MNGVSEICTEEGQRWMRVSPGHAVSERWLLAREPDLYGGWSAAPSAATFGTTGPGRGRHAWGADQFRRRAMLPASPAAGGRRCAERLGVDLISRFEVSLR
ncbi:MAG: hypothetical protein ACR2ND_09295 [Solirubrobacteraceae bacterium]